MRYIDNLSAISTFINGNEYCELRFFNAIGSINLTDPATPEDEPRDWFVLEKYTVDKDDAYKLSIAEAANTVMKVNEVRFDRWIESSTSSPVTYTVGDVIEVKGVPYRANTTHTPDLTNHPEATTSTEWDTLIYPILQWESAVPYVVGNIVVYNDVYYSCAVGNSDVDFTIGNWNTLTIYGFSEQSSILHYLNYEEEKPIDLLSDADLPSLSERISQLYTETGDVEHLGTRLSKGITSIVDIDVEDDKVYLYRLYYYYNPEKPTGYTGIWQTSTAYNEGDILQYDAIYYYVNTYHTSGVLETDLSNGYISIHTTQRSVRSTKYIAWRRNGTLYSETAIRDEAVRDFFNEMSVYNEEYPNVDGIELLLHGDPEILTYGDPMIRPYSERSQEPVISYNKHGFNRTNHRRRGTFEYEKVNSTNFGLLKSLEVATERVSKLDEISSEIGEFMNELNRLL